MQFEPSEIMKKAEKINEKLVRYRRSLHCNAEIGFKLPNTLKLVSKALRSLGATVEPCGRAGLVCSLGSGKRTMLLRADMDALEIEEKTGLPFASKNENMHACGHDIHTSMLLGAYEILNDYRDKIQGRVIFAFQPAEETLEGARDMIDAGLLADGVDIAMMIHVLSATDFKTGYTIVSSPGISAPSSDFFKVCVKGKSSHGGMPSEGKSAISCAARVITSIEELQDANRQIGSSAIVSVGTVQAGKAPNVIAETAELCGTARAYSAADRSALIAELKKIAALHSEEYGCSAEFTVTSSCPPLFNNRKCSEAVYRYARALFGKENCALSDELGGRGGGGSEDFASICDLVPGVAVAISAGSRSEGFTEPLHNPKVRFSDDVIRYGAALLAYSALSYFAENG